MNAFDNVFRTVNILTGKTGRRNKALRAISEWATMIESFLTRFELDGPTELGTLLEKPGDAKFELVGITYNGRPIVSRARVFRGTGLPDLVAVIVNGAENIRRYLMDPVLQESNLTKAVLTLRADYERLRAALDQFADEEE